MAELRKILKRGIAENRPKSYKTEYKTTLTLVQWNPVNTTTLSDEKLVVLTA